MQSLGREWVIYHFIVDRSFAGEVEWELARTERVLFLKNHAHKRRFYDVTRGRENVLFFQQICHANRTALDLAVVDRETVFPINVCRAHGDHRRFDAIDAAEQIFEHRGSFLAAGNCIFKLFKLTEGNGGLKFADSVVQGHEIVIRVSVAIAPRFIDIKKHMASDLFVIGDDHAAFAGGHMLALLKAKAADVADRAGVFLAAFGEKCLRRIFDNGQIMLFREGHDRCHDAWIAEKMRDDDRFCAFADFCLNGLGGDVQGFWINFGKNRHDAAIHERGQCTHIGDRGRNDLVARIRINGCDRNMDRCGARCTCVGVFCPQFLGKCLFEHLAELTLGRCQRTALKRLGDVCNFLFPKRSSGRILIRRQSHQPFRC